MKLAILSESSADEAAVRILVESIASREISPIPFQSLESRGWPAVRNALPAVLKRLHYHTEAEALAIVVDSNHKPLHLPGHEEEGQFHPECRLCILREDCQRTIRQLREVHGKKTIRPLIGLAVPAIEAWYLCGKNTHVSEAAWQVGLNTGNFPYTKEQLKEAVYGSSRYDLALETSRAVEESRRVAQNLDLLRTLFPSGFGVLEKDIRDFLNLLSQ